MAWQIPLSISTAGTAVSLGGTDSLFVGDGVTIASTGGNGVVFGGYDQQVIVHGTVVAVDHGIQGYGVNGAAVTIGESGRVTSLSWIGVYLAGAGTRLDNAGVIEALGPGSYGVYLGATSQSEGSASLDNSGLIQGGTALSIGSNVTSASITNSGEIIGGTWAFLAFGSGEIDIVNTGLMRGDVALGGGNDLFDGRLGTLEGVLLGGGGDDLLRTGTGSQTLWGQEGNDRLSGGMGGDALDGGAGIDRALYDMAARGVTADLGSPARNAGEAAGDSYSGIEGLSGSRFADRLAGGAGSDILEGNGGADRLVGRGAVDTLKGGGGADQFVFNSAPGFGNADLILDFVPGRDEIRLDDAVFTALGRGELAAAAFRANASGQAADATDRIVYETDTGQLWYDRDGTGGAARVQVAALGLGLALGADDIFVA